MSVNRAFRGRNQPPKVSRTEVEDRAEWRKLVVQTLKEEKKAQDKQTSRYGPAMNPNGNGPHAKEQQLI